MDKNIKIVNHKQAISIQNDQIIEKIAEIDHFELIIEDNKRNRIKDNSQIDEQQIFSDNQIKLHRNSSKKIKVEGNINFENLQNFYNVPLIMKRQNSRQEMDQNMRIDHKIQEHVIQDLRGSDIKLSQQKFHDKIECRKRKRIDDNNQIYEEQISLDNQIKLHLSSQKKTKLQLQTKQQLLQMKKVNAQTNAKNIQRQIQMKKIIGIVKQKPIYQLKNTIIIKNKPQKYNVNRIIFKFSAITTYKLNLQFDNVKQQINQEQKQIILQNPFNSVSISQSQSQQVLQNISHQSKQQKNSQIFFSENLQIGLESREGFYIDEIPSNTYFKKIIVELPTLLFKQMNKRLIKSSKDSLTQVKNMKFEVQRCLLVKITIQDKEEKQKNILGKQSFKAEQFININQQYQVKNQQNLNQCLNSQTSQKVQNNRIYQVRNEINSQKQLQTQHLKKPVNGAQRWKQQQKFKYYLFIFKAHQLYDSQHKTNKKCLNQALSFYINRNVNSCQDKHKAIRKKYKTFKNFIEQYRNLYNINMEDSKIKRQLNTIQQILDEDIRFSSWLSSKNYYKAKAYTIPKQNQENTTLYQRLESLQMIRPLKHRLKIKYQIVFQELKQREQSQSTNHLENEQFQYTMSRRRYGSVSCWTKDQQIKLIELIKKYRNELSERIIPSIPNIYQKISKQMGSFKDPEQCRQKIGDYKRVYTSLDEAIQKLSIKLKLNSFQKNSQVTDSISTGSEYNSSLKSSEIIENLLLEIKNKYQTEQINIQLNKKQVQTNIKTNSASYRQSYFQLSLNISSPLEMYFDVLKLQ